VHQAIKHIKQASSLNEYLSRHYNNVETVARQHSFDFGSSAWIIAPFCYIALG